MDRGEDKKRHHKQRLEELRKKTHRRIDYHLQKAYVDSNDFYVLITEFFLDLLERKYQPTYEDLIADLTELKHEYISFTKDQRQEACQLLKQLSETEYTGRNFTQGEAKVLLETFRDLATRMTTFTDHSIEQELHKGFIALEKGNKSLAQKSYQHARKIYDELPTQQKIQFYTDLQELYQAINAG